MRGRQQTERTAAHESRRVLEGDAREKLNQHLPSNGAGTNWQFGKHCVRGKAAQLCRFRLLTYASLMTVDTPGSMEMIRPSIVTNWEYVGLRVEESCGGLAQLL
jgi:hypothetical protein